MKLILLLFLPFYLHTGNFWENNFELAQKKAVEKHQLILLNFSGSDWCGPCIRLKREFFENESFRQFADTSLVLVNADFPRLKKNELSRELTKQNESLADKYNPKGRFPFTLVIDEKGKVLRSFDGLPSEPVTEFVDELKKLSNAFRQ
jgi:thioredoxin-related protein